MKIGDLLTLLIVAAALGYLVYYFLPRKRNSGACKNGCGCDTKKP